jgi:hypothetical protein
MRSLSRVVLVGAVAGVPFLLTVAQAGPPAELALAHTVALGYDLGDGFVPEARAGADVLPEERLAIQVLRERLKEWERYVVVDRPEQADLLIAIRAGRLVSTGVSHRPGAPAPGTATGSGFGLQLSSPQDMMEVSGHGGQIWRGMKKDGLSDPGPSLFASFRAEVEKQDRLAKGN